jgi:hypothetical protein
MNYKEYRTKEEFDPLRDTYCTHCLVPFSDEDVLGRCEQTDRPTHLECTKHNP